jgi:hypothetical protein
MQLLIKLTSIEHQNLSGCVVLIAGTGAYLRDYAASHVVRAPRWVDIPESKRLGAAQCHVFQWYSEIKDV